MLYLSSLVPIGLAVYEHKQAFCCRLKGKRTFSASASTKAAFQHESANLKKKQMRQNMIFFVILKELTLNPFHLR